MTTLNDLTNSIDQLLSISSAQRLLQLNSNTAERAFEAYVLSLCYKAVRNQGGQATITGIRSGRNPGTYVFRGGPGSMASRNQDFCYVDCQLNNAAFEIHVDVEYVGQSRASHEIDVSFYDAQRANEVRNENSSPRTNKPLIMAMECKFYNSRPGVALARTFIGLLSDCTTNQLNAFISNRTTLDIERFLSKKSKPEPFTDLTPLNPDAEDRFIRFLEQKLRKWSISQ